MGNLGRHQIIPIPFNQAQIATPGNPTHPGGLATQYFSYGYTVWTPTASSPICVNQDPNCTYGTMLNNYEGGNVDLRVPYIGYSSESESYTAAGIAAYHALTSHLEKRMSHGFEAGVSYTYSHATDEQSGLGLFYNGNNPYNLRSGYGSSDFDRTHVLNFTYDSRSPSSLRKADWRARRSTTGRCTASRLSRADNPTASSTTRARLAASSTAPSTASSTRLFR